MYSLVMIDNKDVKKVNGVNKNFVDSIRHKELHRIGTFYVGKTSLSWFDGKRYILDDVNSLAYFHGDILNQQCIY